MSITSIDGTLLRKMIIAGSNNLAKNRELLNRLNVFPVPDGDTGNNMALTVLAAAQEVSKIKSPNIYDVAKAASGGSLRGARGNSGVIVSQLFRGIAKGVEGVSIATVDDVANSLTKSTESAYKAVMRPKEGTILTVAKAISDKANEMKSETDDIGVLLKAVIDHGNYMLEQTTEMLPALKQAGVVDSGGKGLMCILEGAYGALYEKGDIEILEVDSNSEEAAMENNFSAEDIKFGYCTEFFITVEKTSEKVENNLKNYLSKIGDSIVVVGDEDIIKIHVHTNNPGAALERAITVGPISNIKIENMREQHSNLINFTSNNTYVEEESFVGFVTVVMGDGIGNTFKELGVNQVIAGGQTMNPSTDDIIKAIEKVNAKNIIILPNNKNIILAAEQAAKLVKDKKVFVVPSKTVPQGINCMVNYVESEDIDSIVKSFNNSINNIATGQVTFAVRDTVIDDINIKEGNYLCIIEGKINNVSTNIDEGTKELIDKMLVDEEGFLSIYYGEETKEEDALNLAKYVEDKYEDVEVEVTYGGQPLYYYIISVE